MFLRFRLGSNREYTLTENEEDGSEGRDGTNIGGESYVHGGGRIHLLSAFSFLVTFKPSSSLPRPLSGGGGSMGVD